MPPREFFAAAKNIAGFSKDYIRKFENLGYTPSNSRRAVPRWWHPPTVGLLKTNYDEVMFRESDKAGIGVVIRNSKGKVLAALSEKILKPPTVEILELLAARRAMSFTAESGLFVKATLSL